MKGKFLCFINITATTFSDCLPWSQLQPAAKLQVAEGSKLQSALETYTLAQ